MSEGGVLPPLILELRAKAGEVSGELAGVKKEVDALDQHTSGGLSKSQKAFSGLATVGKAALFGIGGAAIAIGGEGLKMGVDFQEATTQLVTGAGESDSAIGQVRSGILSLAGQVGQAPVDLAHGMYMIESAGYHGAQGLDVLKAAAQGAKVGATDMTTVSDALTTAMKDYKLPASDAALVTSKLVSTVSQGKTTMGDLAGSLSKILPVASATGVSFNNIMGAMATMTGQGIHAATASTNLKQILSALIHPTAAAAKTLESVGLSGQTVLDSLGKKGVAGTLQLVSDKLKAGSSDQAGYLNSLGNVVGGSRGLAAALALTGKNLDTANAATKNIASTTTEADGSVKGWGKTQEDLGTQIAQAKAEVEAITTRIGMALIPIVEKAIHVVSNIVNWFSKHTTVAKILAGVIGGFLTVSIAAYIAKLAQARVKATADFVKMVAGWVGVGKASTAAAASTVAANEESAAASSAAATEVQAAADATVAANSEIADSHVAAGAAAEEGAAVTEGAEEGMVATSEATGVAVESAFGPIGLAIGAIALVATLFGSHWKAIWHGVEAVAKGAWDDVIKPVFHALETAFHATVSGVTDALHWLQSAWRDVWGAVEAVYRSVIAPVFDFIGSHWKILLGVLTGGLSLLVTNWRDIWGAVQGVYNSVIKPVFDFIASAFEGVWHTIQSALHGIARIWHDVWQGLGDAAGAAMGTVKSVLNDIIGLLNDGVGLINTIIDGVNSATGGVSDLWSWTGIPSIPAIPHIPSIPYLAEGGIVTKPTLALIGDRGPEAVVPMANGARNFPGIDPLPRGGSGGGGEHLTVNVYLDGQPVAGALERVQLRRGMRRGATYSPYSR